jgi:hypothetical protein
MQQSAGARERLGNQQRIDVLLKTFNLSGKPNAQQYYELEFKLYMT